MNQSKIKKIKKEILAFFQIVCFYSIFIFIISRNPEEFFEKLRDVIGILFLFRFGIGFAIWSGKNIMYRVNRWLEGSMTKPQKYKWKKESLYLSYEERENHKIFEETLEKLSVPMVVLREVAFEEHIADYILITRKFIHIVNLQGLYGEIQVLDESFFYKEEQKEFKNPILTNKQILEIMKKQMQKNYQNPVKRLFKSILFDKDYGASAIVCNYRTILDFRKTRKEIKQKLHRIEEFEDLLLYTLELQGCFTYRDKDMFKIADRILGWSKQSRLSMA